MPSLVFPIARVLLALVFVASGLEKIVSWDATAAFMAESGIPVPGMFLVLAASIEMFAGVFLAIGHHARQAALLLVAYLVPVTIVLHAVGPLQGSVDPNPSDFFKNLAIMGGLMLLAAVSPTPLSLDQPVNVREGAAARPLQEREA